MPETSIVLPQELLDDLDEQVGDIGTFRAHIFPIQ